MDCLVRAAVAGGKPPAGHSAPRPLGLWYFRTARPHVFDIASEYRSHKWTEWASVSVGRRCNRAGNVQRALIADGRCPTPCAHGRRMGGLATGCSARCCACAAGGLRAQRWRSRISSRTSATTFSTFSSRSITAMRLRACSRISARRSISRRASFNSLTSIAVSRACIQQVYRVAHRLRADVLRAWW